MSRRKESEGFRCFKPSYTDRKGKKNSSPIIIDVDGEDQLVFMSPDEVIGIGMQDGAIKWRQDHENQYRTNCSTPWWGDDNLLFVSSQGDVGSRTLRLTRSGEKTRIEEIASNRTVKIFHNTALRIGDYLYGSSGSKLLAHNIRSGKTAWTEEGYPEANLVLAADNKVIWLDENGVLGLATISPKGFAIHASHKLLEKPAWTAPTLAGTSLYVRDKERIMALDLAAGLAPMSAGAP